jgi:probable rRNA maturation factor
VAEVLVSVDSDRELPGAGLPEILERAVRAAVRIGTGTSPWPVPADPATLEVSIYITGDEEIRALNRDHRSVDRPTDVLSFSFVARGHAVALHLPSGVPISLGEIILSLPYAERQAVDIGHSVDTELAWLTIHGVLQLLGYVHNTDESAAIMEGLEHRALEELGM